MFKISFKKNSRYLPSGGTIISVTAIKDNKKQITFNLVITATNITLTTRDFNYFIGSLTIQGNLCSISFVSNVPIMPSQFSRSNYNDTGKYLGMETLSKEDSDFYKECYFEIMKSYFKTHFRNKTLLTTQNPGKHESYVSAQKLGFHPIVSLDSQYGENKLHIMIFPRENKISKNNIKQSTQFLEGLLKLQEANGGTL